MKLKYILSILLLGFITVFIGALFKLESYPYASELLLLGFSLKVLAAGLLIVKLLMNKDSKALNS